MIRLLAPWHANAGKRLVKAPKLHIRDSGLFHALHTIATPVELDSHPKRGACVRDKLFAPDATSSSPVRPPMSSHVYSWRTVKLSGHGPGS